MSEEFEVASVEEFGPYLVYERLGVGGMATVHRALERGIEGFERVVALKRLLPHLAEDASFIRSFVREAKLASTLQHPNIVQTLELGRVGATYFISMEFIDGRDVRRVLRHARKVSGPPPINVTLALMIQLCDALDYAHHRTDGNGNPLGIVHRDLSPSNLLLTRNGHLKVIDFGIAKAVSAQLATQTGRVKGKLAYMAPESIAGKELDARSDLFAAGVVFHELLTARPLFAQKNEYQTLLKVQRGDVAPPSTFNEGVPKEVDDIVLRLLASAPEHRWESAAQLRDALVAVRMSRNLSATPRDVQTWCDWAFALDISGFTGKTFTEGLASAPMFANVVSPIARKQKPTPNAASHPDEEAAAEIAWGAPEHDSGKPHLLDDVPDVSGKVSGSIPPPLAPSVVALGSQKSSPMSAAAAAAAEELDSATTSPGLSPSTIKTLAVPPPPRDVRPAGFPNGSSSDPLSAARAQASAAQRTITIPPKDTTGPVPKVGGTGPIAKLDTGRHPVVAKHPTGPAPIARPDTSSKAPPATVPPIPRAPTGRHPTAPPSTARGSTTNLLDDLDDVASAPVAAAVSIPAEPARRATTMPAVPATTTTFGAAIATRKSNTVRNAIIALLAVGGIAAAVVVYLGQGSEPATREQPSPQATPIPPGTVKFVIEPADATIKIAGGEEHVGSPWQLQLAAGGHQVEIHRAGYKSWLTTVELSSNENQTLRVVLEAASGIGSSETATLRVDPGVEGLEVVLDGEALVDRTPLKLEVQPGPHTVALMQDGVEVWSERFTAAANAVHQFEPSMSDEKKRERKRRRDDDDDGGREAVAAATPSRGTAEPTAAPPAIPTPAPTGAGTDRTDKADKASSTASSSSSSSSDKPAPAPGNHAATAVPAPSSTTSAPAASGTASRPAPGATDDAKKAAPPGPGSAKITTTAPPKAPETAKPKDPVTVPPSAVTRTSGSVPAELTTRSTRNSTTARTEVELPAQISSKVCIDPNGRVTSAQVMSKIPDDLKAKLVTAIKQWRYTPYKQGGAAVPACFVASFRSK
jgi:serine/threonine protein kinase